MKLRIEMPIYAHAEFEIEKPDSWGQMSDEEKYSYFLENCKATEDIEVISYDMGQTFVHTGISSCNGEINESQLELEYLKYKHFVEALVEAKG